MAKIQGALVWPNRLRELRESRLSERGGPLLLSDVASATDLSIGYLSRLERGRQGPDREKLARLAAYYGVEPDTIALSKGPTTRVGATDAQIVGAYIRHKRQAADLSIEEAARQVGVTTSLLRMVEAGGRAVLDGDARSGAIMQLVGLPSVRALRLEAQRAHAAGVTARILHSLHGIVPEEGGYSGYVDEKRGMERAPEPLKALVRVGERLVRVDRQPLGRGVPRGSYVVARDEPATHDDPVVVWRDETPTVALLGDNGTAVRLDGPAAGFPIAHGIVQRVVLIIPPL